MIRNVTAGATSLYSVLCDAAGKVTGVTEGFAWPDGDGWVVQVQAASPELARARVGRR